MLKINIPNLLQNNAGSVLVAAKEKNLILFGSNGDSPWYCEIYDDFYAIGRADEFALGKMDSMLFSKTALTSAKNTLEVIYRRTNNLFPHITEYAHVMETESENEIGSLLGYTSGIVIPWLHGDKND